MENTKPTCQAKYQKLRWLKTEYIGRHQLNLLNLKQEKKNEHKNYDVNDHLQRFTTQRRAGASCFYCERKTKDDQIKGDWTFVRPAGARHTSRVLVCMRCLAVYLLRLFWFLKRCYQSMKYVSDRFGQDLIQFQDLDQGQ